MTDLPPISNPWMASGMEAMHEIKVRISRDTRKADLEQTEHYFVGCFGALIGFMMGKVGPEHARTMLGKIARDIEQGYDAGKEIVN